MLLTHLASDCSRSAPLLQQEEELQASNLIQVNGDILEAKSYENDQELFGGKGLAAIDTTLTNEEFVKLCIKRAQKFFNSECGNNEAKK